MLRTFHYSLLPNLVKSRASNFKALRSNLFERLQAFQKIAPADFSTGAQPVSFFWNARALRNF